MRKFMLLVPLLILSSLAVYAQEAEPPDEPAEEKGDARLLQVADDLRLRADQVQQILPVLGAVQERLRQRTQDLDGLWERSKSSFDSVAAAMVAGQEPEARALQTLERAKEQHDRIMEQADADVQKLAGQVQGRLDAQQVALIETAEQRDAAVEARQRFDGAPSLSAYLARYFSGMRQLPPEEYDVLRVAMALRLAETLVPPDSNLYNKAVGDVLRLMDIVRQMPDAEFAQRRDELPAAIARALGLQEQALVAGAPVRLDDFMYFVTHPRTAQVLVTYQAAPAMEVQP